MGCRVFVSRAIRRKNLLRWLSWSRRLVRNSCALVIVAIPKIEASFGGPCFPYRSLVHHTYRLPFDHPILEQLEHPRHFFEPFEYLRLCFNPMLSHNLQHLIRQVLSFVHRPFNRDVSEHDFLEQDCDFQWLRRLHDDSLQSSYGGRECRGREMVTHVDGRVNSLPTRQFPNCLNMVSVMFLHDLQWLRL